MTFADVPPFTAAEVAQFVVLGGIVKAPVAWRTVAQIARDTGLSLDLVNDALADLEAQRYVEAWEVDEAVRVTLTPWGAGQIGARLVEDGPDEIPRWATAGQPDPPAPKAAKVFRQVHALAMLPDPTPPVELVAELAELAELADAGKPPRERTPSRFVGYTTPWPAKAERGPGACSVCGSPPRPRAYCLYCDSPTPAAVLAARSSRRKRPDPVIEAERRRSDRKARRRSRLRSA